MDGEESSERDDDEVGEREGGERDEPAESPDSDDASPGETDASDAPDSGNSPEGDAQAEETDATEPDDETDEREDSDAGSGDSEATPDDRPRSQKEAVDRLGERLERERAQREQARSSSSDDAGDADETDGSNDAIEEDEVDETDPQEHDDEEGEDGPDDEEEDDAIGTFRGNPALEGRTGPDEDREMPLADHIEEMLRRLAVVIAVAGIVSLAVFPVADEVINFLWYSILPGVETEIAQPRVYALLELWFTRIKVASLAGLIVALPVLVYETYAFMKPGLYPHERRYYLAAIPTSLVLAIVGASFAYFIVLPAIFTYFLYYSQDVATIGFALGRTFDLILLMMGYLAIVFQIPLFIMLAMMMGLVTRRWLADRRLLFWGAFLGISFLFGFDPTGMAPILVAATMIVLFEGTLLLTKWTGRE